MKKMYVLGITALVAVFVLIAAFGPSVLATNDPAAGSQTAVFKVVGMTCGGCEVGVKMSVKKLDGVAEVEASHEEGRATVTYDPAKVTPAMIIAAIEKLGYAAELENAEDRDPTSESMASSLAERP